MMRMRSIYKVHWAGGLRHPRGECLPGWPICCSGDKAERLRLHPGACTTDTQRVTCGNCTAMMQRDGAELGWP